MEERFLSKLCLEVILKGCDLQNYTGETRKEIAGAQGVSQNWTVVKRFESRLKYLNLSTFYIVFIYCHVVRFMKLKT